MRANISPARSGFLFLFFFGGFFFFFAGNMKHRAFRISLRCQFSLRGISVCSVLPTLLCGKVKRIIVGSAVFNIYS